MITSINEFKKYLESHMDFSHSDDSFINTDIEASEYAKSALEYAKLCADAFESYYSTEKTSEDNNNLANTLKELTDKYSPYPDVMYEEIENIRNGEINRMLFATFCDIDVEDFMIDQELYDQTHNYINDIERRLFYGNIN